MKEVVDFARVNPDDTEQEVTGKAESNGYFGKQDGIYRSADVGLCDLILTKLTFKVGSDPDGTEGAFFGQDELRVEHGEEKWRTQEA